METSVQTYQVKFSNRQILSIALPICLAILVPQINYITNNIFLGHLDEQSLAAAGITGVYYLIFAVIGNGLNNGLQALISRRAGENKIDEIGKLFHEGIRIAVVIAGIGILITYLLAPMIMRYSLSSPVLQDQVIHFLKIRIWGLPFLYIYQLRNALLIGTNQSKFLIFGTAAETIANIVFDYGFIFGHFGLPQLGFNGAALASIIAEGTGLLVVYAVIHRKGVTRQLNLISYSGVDFKNLKLILVQSSPLILQYAISIASWEFFYILIEHHGQEDLAISNAMRNLFGVIGTFPWAFASTTNTMVSNAIGQGRQDKVLFLIHRIVLLSMSFCVVITLLLNLFPSTFLSIYGQDESFVEHAIPVIRVVSGAIMLMSFATIWLNAVTGTGNTKVNLAIELITIFFYSIYIYLILAYWNLPILYGWMSEWLYWIFTFTLSYLYIRSGRWQKKVI